MSLLGVIFVILFFLKILAIAPVAAWSWWLVCSPLLIIAAFYALVFGGAFVYAWWITK